MANIPQNTINVKYSVAECNIKWKTEKVGHFRS